MRITRLRIDGQEFHLPPELDIQELQQRIIDAVSGLPAFVTFRPVGHGELSVLVTAHLPVRFETEEISDEQYERWIGEPPSIDVFPQID